MNRLDSEALNMAELHINYCKCDEKGFIYTITCEAVLGNYPIPYIQRQAFAERAHYFWLCLKRGLPCF
jgi:hypothetical protein